MDKLDRILIGIFMLLYVAWIFVTVFWGSTLTKRIEALEENKGGTFQLQAAKVYGDALNVMLTDKTNIYVYDGGVFHELKFKPIK